MKPRGVPDFLLLLLTALLVGFGLTMVISASAIWAYFEFGDELYYVKKQLFWVGIGTAAMLVAMNIPVSFYRKRFLLIGLLSLLGLIAVFIPMVGVEVNSARSWIRLGGANLQTSEFAKLGLILYLAAVIAKKGERIRTFRTGLLPPLVVTGLFFILITLQPDLGSAAILLGTAGIVLICGGANLKHLFLLSVPPVAGVLGLYLITHEHAWQRIMTFQDPWSDPLDTGYHLKQSLYALAHGGITGAGYGKSIQKYLYLPYSHNDFIFAVIGEELGFIGTALFLLVYLGFLLRGLYISLKVKDAFASLVGVGIVSMIGLQALINMGGATGSIPITGVPLPFISYGGSSLLACMIGSGILLSISREVNRQRLMELTESGR